MSQATRREVAREATRQEILDAARRLLAEGGPSHVSLRAVAGEIGMTAPGIYRYFPSHEELLLALTDVIVGELSDELVRATDAVSQDDSVTRLLTATRAFRTWCLGHPREFQLTFGLEPAPQGNQPAPHCDVLNVRRMCGFFFDLFVQLWREYRFPVDDEASIDPRLVSQLRAFLDEREVDVPVGLSKVFVDAWTRLFGMVAMEIYGHLRFALDDTEPLFETMLAEYATTLLGSESR